MLFLQTQGQQQVSLQNLLSPIQNDYAVRMLPISVTIPNGWFCHPVHLTSNSFLMNLVFILAALI